MDEALIPVERPKIIGKAVTVLWIAFIILILSSAYQNINHILDPNFFKDLLDRMKAANPSSQIPQFTDADIEKIRSTFLIEMCASIVIGVLFNWFLLWKILKGRNWARILVLIGYILGILSFASSFFFVDLLKNPISNIALPTLSYLIYGYGFSLLMTAPGKYWYKK